MPQPAFHIDRSEEAQQILGRIPSWIIRWGITLIFVILAGIVVGCYFIRYPQTVIAPITITTINPPADLMARATGRIDTIFVKDGQRIGKDQLLALLYNTANYQAVCAIEDSLRRQDNAQIVGSAWVAGQYNLGELQSPFAEFSRVCLEYSNYLRQDYIGKKQGLLSAQIRKNREYYAKLLQQQRHNQSDLAYEQKNLARDSSLFSKGIVSQADYEQSQRALIQRRSSQTGFEASLKSTELGILQMEQQSIELSIQRDDEITAFERSFNLAKQQLVAQIDQWRYQYVVASPIDGSVTFTKYWSSNQSVQAGERLASVVPIESMQIVGRLMIPSNGFGKVEKGQSVNIRLNGYPHMEFGQLKGKVVNISEVPESANEGIFYTAEVALPNGLKTTYNKELALIQQMDGVGEVITQDQRLIQRFLQPVRALFDR